MSLMIDTALAAPSVFGGGKKKKKGKKARKDFAGVRAEAVRRLEAEHNKLPPWMRQGPIGQGLQRQIAALQRTRAVDYAALPDDLQSRVKQELNQITTAPVDQLYRRSFAATAFGI